MIEGILRLIAPRPSHSESSSESSSNNPSKKYDPAGFYLPLDTITSAAQPYWNFRWRGRETGEGEIQLYSEDYLCSISFSNSGTELTGVFNGGCTGQVKFSGVKICSDSGEEPCYGDADREWESLNEAAHESARVGRWH